ncbi:hypothetical protein [Streptomyces sp. NPDC058665]|uniref:hypothetical protein n=1 Tax=Streptomyces sp. NPDC058665 TaxID=3346586 RepID=UPI00364AF549
MRGAGTSKERVYACFSSKVAFVSAQEPAAVADATRMDPTDQPGYAGHLHEYFTERPDRFRESVAHKIEQIHEAQEAGHLDAGWDPVGILVFVRQIATPWAVQPDLLPRTARIAPRSWLRAELPSSRPSSACFPRPRRTDRATSTRSGASLHWLVTEHCRISSISNSG